jgi:hypothetical protein
MFVHLLPRRIRNAYLYYRFRASIRPDDVFLVSYPKSGMTWLTFILANLLKPNAGFVVTLKNTIDLIPDINKLYRKKRGFLPGQDWESINRLPAPRLMRVHVPYDPYLSRAVYLVRDPRAVLVSYWHYHRLTQPDYKFTLRDFILHGNYWPCDWDAHVESWLGKSNVLLIKYSDLRADPLAEIRRFTQFSNLRFTDAQISAALQKSTFEEMRRIEEAHGNAEGSPEPFVRKGSVDGWREELDPDLIHLIQTRYGATMQKLGFPLI